MGYTIAPKLQDDVMMSFWIMMRECESTADNKKDPILMLWVEGWFRQWNTVAGTNLQPIWKTRTNG